MPLDPQILAQTIGRHPARRMEFDALLAGLGRAVEAGNVQVCREGDLALYGYSSTCQFEQRWDLFSLIARGLILDTRAREVVATPFPKFFNFNEGGVPLPDEPFEVSEKIDGSLGIIFHHTGRWRASTRGWLSSPQGQWATAYLNQRLAVDRLTPGTTYLAEIVYPENRIVIPYEYEGLVLLGAYDAHGDELPRAALESVANEAGFRIARAIACESLTNLVQVAQRLTRQEEGFVIRFRGGLRVKLKGDAYCRVHRLICHCTPLALWEAMMNGEDLDAMRQELPEELRADFDAIRKLLTDRYEALIHDVRIAAEAHGGKSDKEIGLLIQDRAAPLSEAQRKFLFACKKQDFLNAVTRPGEWRHKAFRSFRPDGNRLPGYVASSVMTRFEQENG